MYSFHWKTGTKRDHETISVSSGLDPDHLLSLQLKVHLISVHNL